MDDIQPSDNAESTALAIAARMVLAGVNRPIQKEHRAYFAEQICELAAMVLGKPVPVRSAE